MTSVRGKQSSQALESRSHPHSGPQRGADRRGWRREVMNQESEDERPPRSAPGGKQVVLVSPADHTAQRGTRASELWRHTFYTCSARGGRETEWGWGLPDHAEHVGQHVDGRTAHRDSESP